MTRLICPRTAKTGRTNLAQHAVIPGIGEFGLERGGNSFSRAERELESELKDADAKTAHPGRVSGDRSRELPQCEPMSRVK